MKATFLEQFRISVERFPGKTALIWDDRPTTYGELDRLSGAVQARLMDMGVGPGDIVPVILHRGGTAVAAMIGVFRTGAAICCIDMDYPEERKDFIKKDTSAKVVVDAAFMDSLDASAAPREPAQPQPDDPAIVVYTSGSTGNPKGVVNTWRGFTMALWVRPPGRGEDDVFLATAPFSFIASVADVFFPLALGATLCIADDATRRDPRLLADFCRRNMITTGLILPQMLAEVLKNHDGLLRSVITGSERISGLYSEKMPITNVYGASETCGPLTFFPIDRIYDSAPIGFPTEDSKIFILDDDRNRVADGEIGEICVAGQVASGYLNLPELTAERFIPNPWSTGPDDAVIYRTNDLGRFREDGALEYIQRKDWMLKVRGFRVEPGEIEAAILRLGGATHAAVAGFENAAGQTSIYAAYTSDKPLPPEQVADAIRDFLPDYMMPAFLEQLPELPKLPNGKVDRKRLAPPDAARFLKEYEEPRGEAEEAICRRFAEVLGVERAGALDDFVVLGGDSIAAVRLQTALPEFELAPAEILRLRTPRALAAALTLRQPLPKAEPREDWPLTFAERQMAAEQGMNPESISYNVGLAFTLKGEVDADRLEGAVNRLFARHRILRSYYPTIDGEYTHRIQPEVKLEVQRLRCSASQVDAMIEDINKPFDLAKAPLARFALLETGSDESIFYMNMHHIIVDGMSGGLMLDELWKIYGDETPPMPERDFLDWAVWQDAHPPADEKRRFFLDMFSDGVPENEMPIRALRPDVLPPVDSTVRAEMSAKAIEAAARRHDVTVHAFLTSALGIVLGKYCGSEDVVVGVAVNGRSLPETGEMLGMFVNNLPIRIRPEASAPAADHIRRTAATTEQVKSRQDYPFQLLVPVLAPDRNASRSPVFDVQFNYLHELPVHHAAGLDISRREIRGQALVADLQLELVNNGDTIRFALSYSKELYDPQVVENLLEQLTVTIDRLSGDAPGLLVADAGELPESQRRRLLVDFSGPVNDDGLGRTVIDRFREHASAAPSRPALRGGGRALSYGELDRLTDNLAADLQRRGIGKGGRVGVLVKRNEMILVAALGILKTGAAYLPLDPSYPAERLEFMIEDAGAGIVVADEILKDRIPGYAGDWLLTRDIDSLPGGKPEGAPSGDDLFVLIYTSGTTGKPKGVMICHDNLSDLCAWYSRAFAVTPDDAVAAYASFGFDASLIDLYPALTRGASVHVVSEELRLDLPGLNDYFNEHHVTVACMTTQLGRQFAESMDNRSLRILSVGGESLVPLKPPAHFQFINQYGPTEFTVSATTFPVDREYARIPIGRPNDNSRCYIVDKQGRLAPVGTAGELYLSGRGVARGYLNRPELTAEKFIANPFSNDPGYERVYRTGDVVRYLPSGDLDFIGRNDFQVKIRGFRVELPEIEGRIRAHPAIRDAAVVPHDAPGGGKCAVAYVVSDSPVDVADLNAFVEQELPSYMVPAAVMQVDAIPLNPNGKVDRRKLPPPVFGTAKKDESERAMTELEVSICQVVREVLGHDDFSVGANLMQAGLASLSAIKLSTLLHKRFGVALPVKDLMANPSVLSIENGIVRALLGRGDSAPATDGIGHRTVEDMDGYPLTPAQEQMYVLRNTLENETTYNIPSAYRLADSVDEKKLLAAVEALVRRHTSLRTYFVSTEKGLRQRVADAFTLEVMRETCDAASADAVIDSWVKPFSLDEAPLLRCGILSLKEGGRLFFLDMHHIIADGMSIALLLGELSRLYNGEILPPPEADYIDYALWRKDNLDGDALRREKDYWLKQLEGELPYSEIIPDFERPATMDQTGAMASAKLPADKVAALRELAAGNDASLFTIVLAGWGLLLSRYTGTEDVVFGVPFSGRSGPGLEAIPGMFVSTQALRLKPRLDQKVADYLRDVAVLTREAQLHQDAPIAQIIEELGIRRDPSRNPLYSAVLNYFSLGDSPSGLGLEPAAFGSRIAHFDLDMEVTDADGALSFDAVYAKRLYSEDTITALLDRFVRLLTALPESVDKTLGDVGFIGDAERAAVLDGLGFHALPWERERTYDSLFREQAKKTPDNIALVHKDVRLTYGEVDAISDRIAATLAEHGIGPEKIVGLLCERSVRFTLAALGVVKAGGAYMPIDHAAPRERIDFMLKDASVAGVIVDDELRHLVDTMTVPVLSAQEATRPGAPVAPIPSGVRPENAFIVLYTSGSTGNPKGAILEHRSLVAFCRMHVERAAITDKDVSAAYASFAFDASMMDVYPFLATGGTVHVIPEDIRLNLPALSDYFRENGVSCAFMTTQLGKQLIENYDLPALRDFSTGGEKLGVWTRDDRVFRNIYGPTETTIYVNGYVVDKPELRAPIGRSMANIREYVLDRSGRPLPAGCPGELGIAGPQVMRGYIGRPDLNAEKLIPNTFTDDPDYPVIYRTGDVVRFLPNGDVDYLDRIDRQVKIRGFRIEIGEIELRLRELEMFDETAVIDLDDPSGGKYLCCYYTSAKEASLAEVKARLGESMPSYMIPALFMRLDAIPLNQNGKVDRRALPKPDAVKTGAEYAAPTNDAETRLADLWGRILGSEHIGINDNFFEIGGNSIKAVNLQVRMQKEFGVNLPVNVIMQNPTVRELAALLQEGAGDSRALPPIDKADPAEYYPLTLPQQQMYVLWRTLDCKTAYNMPSVYRLDGQLDAAALSRAADDLVARHVNLRTGFKEVDGEVMQFVVPADKARCKKTFKVGKESEVKDILADCIAPFNLDNPPLLRLALVQTGPESHILLLDTHHIVADGLSIPVLMRDLLALYNNESSDAPALDYIDYSVWFDKNLKGAELERQQQFWRDQFAEGVPRLELPIDFPRPALQQTAGAALRQPLPEALFRDLKAMASRHKTTLFSVLLAAWATALARSSGAAELVVGVPHSGRTVPDTEYMPGMFVNTLPMLLKPDGDLTFAQMIDQAASLEQEVQDKQNLSLPDLIDSLNIPRDLSHNPLYDVSFNFIQDMLYTERADGLSVAPYDTGVDSIHFDLTLTALAGDDSALLQIIYATSLFREATARKFLDRVMRILEAAARDENVLLRGIDLIGPDERTQLLAGFNDNAFRPTGKTVCDLVDAHGAARPEAPAVHDTAGNYSFGELRSRSNALAARIHDTVGDDAYVAVMLPRIRDIYVAELGIMKAGCAFLPIDPDYPDSRVETMLEDSGAKLLLTTAALAERAKGFGVPVVDMTDENVYAKGGDFASRARLDGNSYLIYTSGSTGKPKGVMIRHAGFANIMEYFGSAFGLDDSVVSAAYASFSFDVSLIDSWPFLVAGGQVHVIPSEIRLDLDGLAEFLQKNRVTDLHLPTQFGEQFMIEFESPYMKRVLIGGEKMRKRFTKSFDVYNSFGPTETTIDTNFMLVDRDYANIPIGKPAGNVFEYVLDVHGDLLPIGVPGELCISGIQVAAGYLNRPDLTAEKFVPNPYAVDEHTKVMYRTGDLARWNVNGEIEHLGRIDRQVKINGYRIELGEIELALAKIPGVEECAVVDIADSSGGKFLAAYYVAPGNPDVADLRAGLGSALPKYMVPDAFVPLPALPLTPSGKVDRKRLPKPERQEAAGDAAPPETPAQKKIFGVWAQILGHDNFGIDDSFFDIGGNSLKAIRTVSILKNAFDIDINRMYQFPTIRGLADNSGEARVDFRSALQQAKQRLATGGPVPAVPEDVKERYDACVAEAAELDLDETVPNGGVLLCGATGFLGAFLLDALVRRTGVRVHALVRGKTRHDAENRLLEKMRYYFGETYMIPGERVAIWKGDLEAEGLGLSADEYKHLSENVDIVLNTAANVRHYGKFDEFYQSNVQSVLNLIEFARNGRQKRLGHVSTMSVAHGYVEGKDAVPFGECDIDIGQSIDNVYVRTKLMAETEVMRAARDGLDAQIFRVGNITADSRRGVVQQNIEENGFYSTLKSMINLGVMSRSASRREFSHVDKIAEAIRLLFDRRALGGQIFHIHNPDLVDLGSLFTRDKLGLRVDLLDDGKFIDYLSDHVDLESVRDYIESVLLHTGWLDNHDKITRFMVMSGRTQAVLSRLGFEWGPATVETVRPMVRKALEDRALFLESTPLFEGASLEDILSFAGLARMEAYAPDRLIENGDVREFGIVREGVVEQSIVSRQGWQGTVRALGRGKALAHSVLSGGTGHSLYEPILEEALILWFGKEDMEKILKAHPSASLYLIEDLAKTLEGFQRLWVDVG